MCRSTAIGKRMAKYAAFAKQKKIRHFEDHLDGSQVKCSK
jgi:hypothetical protein